MLSAIIAKKKPVSFANSWKYFTISNQNFYLSIKLLILLIEFDLSVYPGSHHGHIHIGARHMLVIAI